MTDVAGMAVLVAGFLGLCFFVKSCEDDNARRRTFDKCLEQHGGMPPPDAWERCKEYAP